VQRKGKRKRLGDDRITQSQGVPAIPALPDSCHPSTPPRPHPRRTCSSRPASDTNQRGPQAQPPCRARPPGVRPPGHPSSTGFQPFIHPQSFVPAASSVSASRQSIEGFRRNKSFEGYLAPEAFISFLKFSLINPMYISIGRS
jgi:hypothetical protein